MIWLDFCSKVLMYLLLLLLIVAKKSPLESLLPNVEEALSTNAPKPLGKEVKLRMFIDSDHAGDKAACWSHTGYMIFLNMSIIDWLSKKQATVEGAVFGAQFVA